MSQLPSAPDPNREPRGGRGGRGGGDRGDRQDRAPRREEFRTLKFHTFSFTFEGFTCYNIYSRRTRGRLGSLIWTGRRRRRVWRGQRRRRVWGPERLRERRSSSRHCLRATRAPAQPAGPENRCRAQHHAVGRSFRVYFHDFCRSNRGGKRQWGFRGEGNWFWRQS